MADLRRPMRLVLTLALVVLGLFELQNLLEILLSQSRLRERAIRGAQEALKAGQPQIDALLAPGGPASWDAALEVALRSTSAAEVELFTPEGERLAAQPRPAPVSHWLPAPEVMGLRGGTAATIGPLAGAGGRLLTYAAVRSGGRDLVLRLSTAASDLMDDLRERRQLLVGHGVAMVLVVIVAVLAAFPGREPGPASTPRAIDAYVAAMERLRDHGEALSQRHEALEDALQDREAMARAGELTAGMVHEVRNGLGTIVGYARLMEGGGAAPAVVDAATRIREECETLETVVRRFMDFVKYETLNLGPMDLGRMLTRVVARESRGRPGGEVTLEGSGGGGPLVGDEDLLERAFENLVRNAREAAGVKGHVWIRSGREGEAVVVTVSDDGPGIPEASRRGLRPFVTTKAGGLGLGLPIALKIVRLHAGELALSDRSPRGLVVTVRLPAQGPDNRGVTGSSAGPGGEGRPRPGNDHTTS
jgi:signal transduction histidine kinase